MGGPPRLPGTLLSLPAKDLPQFPVVLPLGHPQPRKRGLDVGGSACAFCWGKGLGDVPTTPRRQSQGVGTQPPVSHGCLCPPPPGPCRPTAGLGPGLPINGTDIGGLAVSLIRLSFASHVSCLRGHQALPLPLLSFPEDQSCAPHVFEATAAPGRPLAQAARGSRGRVSSRHPGSWGLSSGSRWPHRDADK